MKVYLVFPHQLFREPPIPEDADLALLLEDPLFFSRYRFHRGKLVYQRATMRRYAEYLRERGTRVAYAEAAELNGSLSSEGEAPSDPKPFAELLRRVAGSKEAPETICFIDPTDERLERKITAAAALLGSSLERIDSPGFFLSRRERCDYAEERRRLFMAEFYKGMRKSRDILMDNGAPVGGAYSFDTENRKRLPKGLSLPEVPEFEGNPHLSEAVAYVDERFPRAPGEYRPFAPTTFEEADEALRNFVDHRLAGFGDYQDAVEPGEPFLFHSLLSPAINVGLLTPDEVVSAALLRAGYPAAGPPTEKSDGAIPLNSLEGFVRQIVGWREFMLISYESLGEKMRSRNYFGFHRPMPEAFYTGKTGLDPVDEVIARVTDTGYAHHIERLMFLGNPMLLCGIDPAAVYRWFMELFIDAYDWVMVPNVYGMSQFADGGLITTKPYISSSNYIRKMSRYRRGNWATVWDALFWRFVAAQRELFEKNPRMKMMARRLDRMPEEKLQDHHRIAEGYLRSLHEENRPAQFVESL